MQPEATTKLKEQAMTMNTFNNPHPRSGSPERDERNHHDHHSPDANGDFPTPGNDGGDLPGNAGHDDRHGPHHGRGSGPHRGGPDCDPDDNDGAEAGDRGPRGFGSRRGGPRGGPGGFGPGFGQGFGPGFGSGFGPGMGFGPGLRGGFGRGGRVRKGNVRSAILSLLGQHSYNGYGLIGAIATHTDGAWRPSPGSIYPALAALQAEGLIESTGNGKRTEFGLTEAGSAYVAGHPEEMAAVWAEVNEEAGAGTDLRQSMGKLAGAVQQIGMAGTEDQVKAATGALDTARRAIYKLLAD